MNLPPLNEQSIKTKRAETDKKGDDLVEWKERRGTTPPGMEGWMDGHPWMVWYVVLKNLSGDVHERSL